MLGVTRGRVWQLCNNGILKYQKFGKALAIDEQSVKDRLNDENAMKYRRNHDNDE